MNPLSYPSAFIDALGGPEMLVIFFIVLLLFGGDKMPEFAKGLAKSIREFKKATSGVEEEFKRAMEEPPETPKPLPTITPPAATVPQHQIEAPAVGVAEIESGVTHPTEQPGSVSPDHSVAEEPHPSPAEPPVDAHQAVDTKPKISVKPAPEANTDWL